MPPGRSKWKLLWRLSATALVTFGVDLCRGSLGGALALQDICRHNSSINIATAHDNVSLSDTSGIGSVQDSDEQEERRGVSLCLLLIVRDEEESIKKNLPLWKDLVDCVVIGIDDRTTDGTATTLHQILQDKERFVFFFTFQDFAQARNTVIRSTGHMFPDVSHILVADADWTPDLETVDRNELDFVHGSFPFLVWDHSGHTTRVMGWLLRFDKHLRFKYRVHEVLDTNATVTGTLPSKFVGWEVRVVESHSSWSSNLHQHGRSSNRFLFDLELLELDYLENPRDLHTLFYLGLTKFAYIESLIGKGTHEKTPELEALITSGMSYFGQAVGLPEETEKSEFLWGSKRWLAYGYHYFIGDVQKAEGAYKACIDYDPARVDCVIFLSRLYLSGGDLEAAWEMAMVGLLHRPSAGRAMSYFYIFECFVPMQAAKVVFERVSGSGFLGNDTLEGLLTLGSYLVRHHRNQCHHGVMVDSLEDLDRLEKWFEESVAREGLDVEETKRVALQNVEGSLLALLLRTWGTGVKASSALNHMVQQQQQQQQRHGEPTANELAQSSFDSDPREASERQDLPPPTSAAHGVSAETGVFVDASEWAPLSSERCAEVVEEARARLGLDEQAAPGVLAASSLAQIDAVLAERTGRETFRGLVFGGAEVGGGAGSDNEISLERHEDLLQVVSLVLGLSSAPEGSEITYASPKSSVVRAARSVATACASELGIGDGRGRGVRLDFVSCASLDDYLRTASDDRKFDYADVGGPLSLAGRGSVIGSGNGGNDDDDVDAGVAGEADAAVLRAETLELLGAKLAPGAYLRAWAFAANPATEFAFHTAAKSTAAAAAPKDESRQATSPMTELSAEQLSSGTSSRGSTSATATLLDRVLRATFGAGAEQAKSPPILPGSDEDEKSWVQQAAASILAGGDRLSLQDVDETLAGSGFELALTLGKNATERGGVTPARVEYLGDLEEELLEEGLSRWEIADLASTLEGVPTLMHEVLAVWRGGDRPGAALSH